MQLVEFVGVVHAIGVANGSDALQIALMALGVGPGDAVFTPTFTFVATAEVIRLVGAQPVFVYIEPSTYNIDPADLDHVIDKTIRAGPYTPAAIMAADLFGLAVGYNGLSGVAQRYDLGLVEDTAQGFGGAVGSQRCCSFGRISTTSFFPEKPLGCYGEGRDFFQ